MNNLPKHIAAILILLMLASANTLAESKPSRKMPSATSVGTMIFDFESDNDVHRWHDEHKTTVTGKTLRRVRRFATSGDYSMEFTTPKWKKGMPEWPAFECIPPITDWSKAERLVFDVTNASSERQELLMFISDSHTRTRKGLHHRVALEPLSYTQVVVDLTNGFRTKKIDPSDIHVIHFFTTRPPANLRIYIDRMILLKKGEKLPLPAAGYKHDFIKLQDAALLKLRAKLANAQRWLDNTKTTVTPPGWITKTLTTWRKKGAELDRKVAENSLSMPSIINLPNTINEIISFLNRTEDLGKLWSKFKTTVGSSSSRKSNTKDVIAGFATSMEKVLPKAGSLSNHLRIARQIKISLAKGEKEAFQVIVIPYNSDLKQVGITISDLSGKNGAVFKAKDIHSAPVGYVRTESVPPYGTSHIGWWPDPILDFMDTAAIAEGVAQAFWIRIHAPANQPSGTYHGKLTVCDKGVPLLKFDLSVRVYNFSVPLASPLPLAITFHPSDHPLITTRAEQRKWRKTNDYPVNAWKKHRQRWANFLSDYYITFDSLYAYRNWAPDFDILSHLKAQGKLGRFNLGYFWPCPKDASEQKKWREKTIDKIAPRYQRAKALGMIDHAYIYGCDECTSDKFPALERAAAILKKVFPGVMIMTTSYDTSYGADTPVKSVDAWCPLIVNYDKAKANKARLAGRKVWWYICCSPHHPYPNMFVEYPAIDGRLLMGAMTAKYRPDGFLYYQISIWNSRTVIKSGPFTDWNPRSWTSYNGDGSWTCVGPDGIPLPTIRLENFRDGLEDYAYILKLQDKIKTIENRHYGLSAAQKAWLTEAKSALNVPESLVRSLTQYSGDPQKLYAWRDRIGNIIDRAAW